MKDGHELIAEICGFINRWPVSNDKTTWRRFRVAVSREELELIKTWYRNDNQDTLFKEFAYALRGVPLVIEEYPTEPLYKLESF